MPKPLVVIGLLGPTLDNGLGAKRWSRWRPSVSVAQHEDLAVSRFHLLHQRRFDGLAETVVADCKQLAPDIEVRRHHVEFDDPWDFEDVYSALWGFARGFAFDREREDYLIHITTGTHVAQICLFLLTEARWFPARLLQTGPSGPGSEPPGTWQIIDLDLSRYDKLAARFRAERAAGVSLLTAGIPTRNAAFATLIQRIERVAAASTAPILLAGPTGAGKTRLARRIFELKKARALVDGPFVEVNCATLKGDGAMSTLFGHRKGAFTGALADREGLLKRADGGVLFLDEIGDLGADEQAMLLRAIEDKTFLPLGSDVPVQSDFQLIAGSNRDLTADVRSGLFRDDLYARIELWTFRLPGLAERREDIEANVEHELERFAGETGTKVAFNSEGRDAFLRFATAPDAVWSANFRDLGAAVTRMATLSAGGRIGVAEVREEADRLRARWQPASSSDVLDEVLGARADELDRFDRVQLADVIAVCRASRSQSDAGRTLFAASRVRKRSSNDADRLAKYLARFGLDFASVQRAPTQTKGSPMSRS
ncbi:MAG: sigma 54-interacting transcriptional regulator [Planctomycetes bacterium]|nr:sigma 54-interacting transcriptional regulator [Planctomycetota bacterium]